MSLNSQLQSLAESYNDNISQHLEQLANNQAQAKLDQLNDIVSKATGIENAGQLIGGSLAAGKGVTETITKTKQLYDKIKASKPTETIKKNVGESTEGTELSDVTAETTGEEVGEIGATLGLESVLGPFGLLLDIGTLASLGITAGIGLAKKHKEKAAENSYQSAVKNEKHIQNQAHTISSIVSPTGQNVVTGGITSLD